MTTNIELISLAKALYIPNFYCIMIDEFLIIEVKERPLSIICNLQDSTKNGSHWVMCFISLTQKIFYCSYGSPIPLKIKTFLMSIDDRSILSSNFQIQDFNENTCGYYCLLILYLLNEGEQFEDIILNLIS